MNDDVERYSVAELKAIIGVLRKLYNQTALDDSMSAESRLNIMRAEQRYYDRLMLVDDAPPCQYTATEVAMLLDKMDKQPLTDEQCYTEEQMERLEALYDADMELLLNEAKRVSA